MKKREILQHVAELRAAVNAAKKQQSYLTGRIEAMDTRVAELATPVARLTTRVNGLNDRLDEAERLLGEVDRRDAGAVFEQVRVRFNEMLEGVERKSESVEAVKVEAERKAKVLDGMKERMERLNIPDLAKNVAWLHERVAALATRLENMRGNVTLDDSAAQRLTYAVGQFSARLDRLEAPRRKRKPKPEPTPNGEAAA